MPSDPPLSVSFGCDEVIQIQAQGEMRFKLESSLTASGLGISFGSASDLPAAMTLADDAKDPSISSNANYVGAWSVNDFAGKPCVINGEAQSGC